MSCEHRITAAAIKFSSPGGFFSQEYSLNSFLLSRVEILITSFDRQNMYLVVGSSALECGEIEDNIVSEKNGFDLVVLLKQFPALNVQTCITWFSHDEIGFEDAAKRINKALESNLT